MTASDIQTLLHVITRTGMFTMKDDAGYIVSFIHGYEIGRNGKCCFSDEISEVLEKEFGLKKMATGWNGQITEFGKQNKLSWETSFKKIGLRVLSRYFPKYPKNRFEELIKLVIKSKISQIQIVKFKEQRRELNWFGKEWINKWMGIVSLNDNWFRAIWNNKELEIISKIDVSIANIKNKNKETIIANNTLVELSMDFQKLSKTDTPT